MRPGVSLFLLIALFFLIGESACLPEDPCEGVTCLNGGFCSIGICDCPGGTTGDDCSIFIPDGLWINSAVYDDAEAFSCGSSSDIWLFLSLTNLGTSEVILTKEVQIGSGVAEAAPLNISLEFEEPLYMDYNDTYQIAVLVRCEQEGGSTFLLQPNTLFSYEPNREYTNDNAEVYDDQFFSGALRLLGEWVY
jgi:hypothetical protein